MKSSILFKIFICVGVFLLITFAGVASAQSNGKKINQDLSLLLKEPASSVSDIKTAINPTVNINTATLEELCALDGIGEVKAKAIIDYREHNGGFIETEEIMRVKGISKGIYDKIKEHIYV